MYKGLGHANAKTVLRYADQRNATIDAEIRTSRRRRTTGRSIGRSPTVLIGLG